MTLSKREKTITILTLVVIIIWLFNTFLYAPRKKALARAKEEFMMIGQGMTQAIALSAESKNLEKELNAMKERFNAFKEKITAGKNISPFIKVLASETSKLNIKVVSMVPQEEPLDTEVKQYKSYLINLKLVSGYKPLVLFLDRLKELPILIMIDGFDIEKTEKNTGDMKMDLNLRVCFIQGE